MEELAEGVGNITLNDTHKKNRIQVSNTKKPLFFYVNLAKRYMQQHEEVELSALGMAIATVVTVAEILKNNGLAVEKRILTSTVDMKDEARGRPIQKAKVEIILAKADRFDELMDATTEERELVGDADEQNILEHQFSNEWLLTGILCAPSRVEKYVTQHSHVDMARTVSSS